MNNDTKQINDDSIYRQSDDGDSSGGLDFKKVLSGIQKHLIVIAISSLLCVALGAYGTRHFSSNFQATAILIFQEQGQSSNQNLPASISIKPISLTTAIDLISLPSNFQALKAVLGLELPAAALQGMVSVTPPKGESQFIQIVGRNTNPNLAIDLANTLANISVKSSREYIQKQLQTELDSYKAQLDQAQQKLNQNRSEIEVFKTTHRYFEMTANYTTLTTQLIDAQELLQNSIVNYNSLLVEYENLKREVDLFKGTNPTASGISKGPSLKRTRYEALQSALSEAKARYAPGNPKIKLIEDEIKGLTGEISKEGEEITTTQGSSELNDSLYLELIRLDAKVRAAQKTKEDLAAAVSQMEETMKTLPAEQVAFSKLLEQKALIEEQVRNLSRAVETIKLMINVPKGGIEIYSTANSAKPLRESTMVTLLPLIGLFGGFVAGLGLAIILEIIDGRIVTLKQVEFTYSIHPIGLVPQISGLDEENSIDKSLFFIRRIAERLERFIKVKPFSIAFCSAKSDEGKSFISYHLAHYYAKLGKKTILIQADPRPSIFSEKPPAKDLLDYLRGEIPWQEIINHNSVDEIKVGGYDPHLKELLKSEKMMELFVQLKKDYQAILVDAGGIIEDPYAINLASICDVNVFVINSSKTQKKFVDESLIELAHSGHLPCGIILNKVPPIYIYDEKLKKHMKTESPGLVSRFRFWK